MSLTVAGKPVGRIGYGMIPLNNPANNMSTADAIEVLNAAVNAGANFLNAGMHYGTYDYNSLHVLKAYFEKYPEDANKVVISVKGGFDVKTRSPKCKAEDMRAEIERCLEVADGKYWVDIFQPGRLDPDVPVEETIGACAEFVKAGKIGSVGLSECSATSIRKAVAVTPISAVEVEVSLFTPDIFTNGVAEACKESGIPIIAYSPLSRGFLTGQLRRFEDMAENDFRRMLPRFQPDVFDENFKIVQEVEEIAKRKGCSAGQVAIAWVSAQSKILNVPVIPIPGTGSTERLKENLALVELTDDEVKELNAVVEKLEVKGGRYPAVFQKHLHV